MLTDAEVKALTTNVQVRNVIHMLQDDLRKAQAEVEQHKLGLVDQAEMIQRIIAIKDKAEAVIEAQDALIKTQELQIHDNQTLREDYESLLRAYDLLKQAVHRDEETIKELKAVIKEPVKSETFKEVRDERDQALKKVALLADTIKELQAEVKRLQATIDRNPL